MALMDTPIVLASEELLTTWMIAPLKHLTGGRASDLILKMG